MERERSQGTARWMRSIRAALDGVTRRTLICGSSPMLLPCLSGEGRVWAEPSVTINWVPNLKNQPCPYIRKLWKRLSKKSGTKIQKCPWQGVQFSRNTYCWKYTNKYMYMVYMTLQRKYFNTAFTTLGFCKFFKSLFYTLNIKDFSSISGAEHKMVVD